MEVEFGWEVELGPFRFCGTQGGGGGGGRRRRVRVEDANFPGVSLCCQRLPQQCVGRGVECGVGVDRQARGRQRFRPATADRKLYRLAVVRFSQAEASFTAGMAGLGIRYQVSGIVICWREANVMRRGRLCVGYLYGAVSHGARCLRADEAETCTLDPSGRLRSSSVFQRRPERCMPG